MQESKQSKARVSKEDSQLLLRIREQLTRETLGKDLERTIPLKDHRALYRSKFPERGSNQSANDIQTEPNRKVQH